jgi:amino acid adenylation domain-containing protein
LINGLTAKIYNTSKQLGVTPYMLLLSVYYILLSKYSSQEDIVVGSPIVGRNIAELYNLIGMFVNTLAMRANIDSNLSFKDFLSYIKDMCLNNYKYQDYPFDELVDKLKIQRDTSRNPLFDVMFIYQNNGNATADFGDIKTEYFTPDTKISKFDLSLEVIPENDILNLSFEYATALFNKQFIEDLSKHYSNILTSCLDNLNIKISNICMLSEAEKNKILYDFNNTKTDYPKDKTIAELFEEQANKTPNNVAVVFGMQKLTYKELNEKANSLAYYLRKNGIETNDLVGIMVNRSLEMIIGMLAVLKAGGAYIPIDPTYPKDRIEYMLKNSNSKLLLTQEHLHDITDFKNCVYIDLSNDSIYSLPNDNLNHTNTPEDLAYVIYTSGSTGLPKGVMLKQRNIVNFVYAIMKDFGFTYKDTIVSITTFSFDIFVLESLLPILNGLKTVITSEEEQTDIKMFNELCKKNNVTIFQTTPSRLQAMLAKENSFDFIKKLKYILIGGEPFPPALLKQLQGSSKARIYNMYGPTETAVWSSLKDLTNADKINIGKAISNTQLYILDKFNNPLPVGVPGELFIAGDGVCKGYYNNLELTQKVFLNNPFVPNELMYKTGDLCMLLPNGEVEYLERVDNQIKIRGLRIELGEIESKILDYNGIEKVCVIKQTINNRDFISAYFTASKRINPSSLKKYLSNYLPKYMIPSYFTVLEKFPYTPNGKIDKKALKLPEEVLSNSREAEYIAPRTDLEKQFCAIWEQILNVSPIGITDNFFELGGDSILAMNLNLELKSITDSISYADIFKFPTIAELVKKSKSKDEDYDFKYMEKNYDKYTNLLNSNIQVPNKNTLKYQNCGNVLITGATGFLGMHVLESFINKEKGKAYCIVRSEPGLTAGAKLHQKLNYYFGNKYDKLIGKRIFALTGDICKTGFGLNQEDLSTISNDVDVVINTAARVAHYGNYYEFYNINVKSVQYAVDFCKSFNKKLYHISTLSVSGEAFDTSIANNKQNATTLFRENNLYIGQSLENVYVRSKFEAECLVLDSIIDGLDAYILRVR